jgi:TldD protein
MTAFDENDIKRILDAALGRGGEFAELYHEYTRTNSIALSERRVKSVSGGISEGVGVRVLMGERTGYAHSDDLSMESLVRAAEVASFVAAGYPAKGPSSFTRSSKPSQHAIARHAHAEGIGKKVDLLKRADDAARGFDERVREVGCGYGESYRRIEIANSEGQWVAGEDELMRMSVSVLAIGGDVRDSGVEFLGGRYGFEYFDEHSPEEAARKAARQAVTKLSARPAPAGIYPVLLDAGWGGVLVHEGVGHGLEGDFNRKGTSIYSGQLDKEVCSKLVSIIDDGTVPNARGSLAIDDEGSPMQKTVLIKDGVLVGFLYDRLNAELMKTRTTGNGRRESFRHVPLPRMRNTYIDAGKDTPEDLRASISKGIYAKVLGGGQVDIVSGNFVFEISEGYMIENGRVGEPLRGANLIGNGPDAMKKVIGVGNDLQIEKRTGSCGKDGQYVPVGVGQPTILISEMTIGGTET